MGLLHITQRAIHQFSLLKGLSRDWNQHDAPTFFVVRTKQGDGTLTSHQIRFKTQAVASAAVPGDSQQQLTNCHILTAFYFLFHLVSDRFQPPMWHHVYLNLSKAKGG